jgi:hypothetical protein
LGKWSLKVVIFEAGDRRLLLAKAAMSDPVAVPVMTETLYFSERSATRRIGRMPTV